MAFSRGDTPQYCQTTLAPFLSFKISAFLHIFPTHDCARSTISLKKWAVFQFQCWLDVRMIPKKAEGNKLVFFGDACTARGSLRQHRFGRRIQRVDHHRRQWMDSKLRRAAAIYIVLSLTWNNRKLVVSNQGCWRNMHAVFFIWNWASWLLSSSMSSERGGRNQILQILALDVGVVGLRVLLWRSTATLSFFML